MIEKFKIPTEYGKSIHTLLLSIADNIVLHALTPTAQCLSKATQRHGIDFRVVAPQSVINNIPKRSGFETIEVEKDSTAWFRDCLFHVGNNLFHTSAMHSHGIVAGQQIATALGLGFKERPGYLQGGNILGGENEIFMGADVWSPYELNPYLRPIDDSDRRRVILPVVDRQLEMQHKAIGHIDLTMAHPAPGVVLLGKPDLMTRLRDRKMAKELDLYKNFLNLQGYEVHSVPINPLKGIFQTNMVLDGPGKVAFVPEYLDVNKRYFSETAAALESLGYEVEPIAMNQRFSKISRSSLRCLTLPIWK